MPAEGGGASSRESRPGLAISSQAGRRAIGLVAATGLSTAQAGGPKGPWVHVALTMGVCITGDRPRSALGRLDRQVRIARARCTAKAKLP